MSALSIAVVGSVNLDIVARVQRFPKPGETLTDATLQHFPGGKGANQALAARRLGADVHMVACVGNDGSADEALANLAAEGVHLECCRRLDDVMTGTALILVSDDGENQIVVAPGANRSLGPEMIELPGVNAVIAQLEIPLETVIHVARSTDAFFCLNAAPARPVAAEVLDHTDLLIVNETEAEAIGDALPQFQGLLAKTLGSRGATLSRRGKVIAEATPPRVDVVDTTGAGDAFTAALVVALASGLTPDEALRRACAVGALATTRLGAQSSPTAREVDRCLQS